jgi:hypothetical protein
MMIPARVIALLAGAVITHAATATADPAAMLILVVGAAGTPDYAARFQQTARRWQEVGARAKADIITIGFDKTGSDRGRLQAAVRDAAARPSGPLWLILIGHGTHDGRVARFNLRGPDVSAPELAAWCKPIRSPLIVVDGTSASGPFLPALAGPARIIVTATKSGAESNATRFGDRFAEAIGSTQADLDGDGGVSVLEAFLWASRQVEASFQADGLLASEHALIEDTGDGRGTPAGLFHGLDPGATAPGDTPRDGARAHQVTLVPAPAQPALPPDVRKRRDQLEAAIAQLRAQRPQLSEAVYFERLERLLLPLAQLYRKAGRLP